MNEEFDDRLKNRITDVFDNYEDDSAHEGWLLLREKYPEEKKRRGAIWLWWGSAAAVLLAILSIGIWMHNNIPADQIVKQPVKNTVPNNISKKQMTSDNNLVAGHNTKSDSSITTIQSAGKAVITNPNTQKSLNNSNNAKVTSIHKYIAQTSINKRAVKHSHTNIPDQQNTFTVKEVANQTVAVTSVQPKQPEAKAIDSAVLANNSAPVQSKITTPEHVKPVVKEPKKAIFADLKPNDIKPNKQVDNKVKFGVYAATYFNYSQGSDNQFNVGAGLSSEIKLVGNFKLSTGILIGQNSFDYKTAIPQTANNYIAASIAKNNNALDAPPAASASTGSVLAASTPISPVIRNYQASLLALDIPINLKYQFSKSDTYISAGVSSGTYLNETYNFAYNYNSGYLANNNQQNTQTKNSFNTFDFAKTLNISFGTGYSLGKNRLIIEPFVKYPLGGLGSQNIKFGAGGLNLKLNFSPAKK